MAKSVFSAVESGPPIEVFKLSADYKADTFDKKVDLGVGAYRTNEGIPYLLPVVKKTEQKLASDIDSESINHEYLPILGLDTMSSAATRMLLGEDSKALANGMAFGIQSLSGTGALRNGAEFLNRILKYNTFYFSDPTWGNHGLIFKYAGFTDARKYRYFDSKNCCLDIDGMLADLEGAPENSVIILHACAHNPTGCDPTKEQWEKIANVMEKKKLFPFFDCAYQGFASGDLSTDAWSVRYFVERGFELFCAQSFSKNFGLYNERAGNLTIVVNDKEKIGPVKSQLTLIVRAMYSNPPAHGARIVNAVLNDKQLFAEWCESIKIMSGRIIEMRNALKSKLVELGTPGNWDHITTQIGMFSYTGLNAAQCEYLIKEHHIYLLRSGRISMCGITPKNVDYVANAIYSAIKNVK